MKERIEFNLPEDNRNKMKAIIEFNIPEEQEEYNIYMNALAYKNTIDEFLEETRRRYIKSDTNIKGEMASEEVINEGLNIREFFWELLQSNLDNYKS